jgi:hypothetical protein
MDISLTALDVGFDVRTHGLTRLPFPLRGIHSVCHHSKGTTRGKVLSTGTLTDLAESLARAGYSVVPCLTANGRDVQCTPAEDAPVGNGDLFGTICWAVQARDDNYWCRGATLHAALGRGDWTETDLRPVNE